MRKIFLCLVVALAGCGEDFEEEAHLYTIDVREVPMMIPADSRFLTAKVDGFAVCEEIAELYNNKESVVTAGVVRFQCEAPR
jgi:hypothetical protein